MEIIASFNEIIVKLISNINENELCFGGSISDYINFKLKNIDVNIGIKDIDLCVYDIKTVKKIEKILGITSRFVRTVNNLQFKHSQFVIVYNEISIDIFLREKDFKYKIITYNGKKLSYTPIDSRIDILKRVILDEYNNDLNDKHKPFKYLKKIMIYKRIIK